MEERPRPPRRRRLSPAPREAGAGRRREQPLAAGGKAAAGPRAPPCGEWRRRRRAGCAGCLWLTRWLVFARSAGSGGSQRSPNLNDSVALFLLSKVLVISPISRPQRWLPFKYRAWWRLCLARVLSVPFPCRNAKRNLLRLHSSRRWRWFSAYGLFAGASTRHRPFLAWFRFLSE